MLIELYGKNFGCFRDEFRLSMLATDIDPGDPRGVVEVAVDGDDEPLRLLRAAAIYGPNASGKTTVIRAAEALNYVLASTARLQAHERIARHAPHLLSERVDPQVQLGLVAVVDGKVYDYSTTYGATEIYSERLLRLESDSEEPTVLLARNGRRLEGVWAQERQFELIGEAFRANASVLGLAGSLAPGLASRIVERLLSILHAAQATHRPPFAREDEPVARRALDDDDFRRWLGWALDQIDAGVVGVDPKRHDIDLDERGIPVVPLDDGDLPPRSAKSYTTHSLSLVHAGEGRAAPIPYHLESHGTRQFVRLSPLLYDLTESGEVTAAFVDELDASMHPTLLAWLVGEFNARLPVDHQSQLIFTAHETVLFDGEARSAVLRRDQVYFTEKGKDGAARLYSLADFQERQNVNLRRRYLQGRYGALPLTGSL